MGVIRITFEQPSRYDATKLCRCQLLGPVLDRVWLMIGELDRVRVSVLTAWFEWVLGRVP